MKIPKYIKDKIKRYINYSQKANDLREDIEQWFAKKGNDIEGITEVLIDSGYGYGNNVEKEYKETIDMLENL